METSLVAPSLVKTGLRRGRTPKRVLLPPTHDLDRHAGTVRERRGLERGVRGRGRRTTAGGPSRQSSVEPSRFRPALSLKRVDIKLTLGFRGRDPAPRVRGGVDWGLSGSEDPKGVEKTPRTGVQGEDGPPAVTDGTQG